MSDNYRVCIADVSNPSAIDAHNAIVSDLLAAGFSLWGPPLLCDGQLLQTVVRREADPKARTKVTARDVFR